MRKIAYVTALAGLAFFTSSALADVKVVYPAPENAADVRYNDLIEILKTALEKTTPQYGAFTIAPASSIMNEARQLESLEKGEALNIVWSSTSEEKESKYHPIRIPLRKGLLGFRISLIKKDVQAKIDQVKTLDDLKKLSIGQGVGWGDVKLYESNGLRVQTAQYEQLFKMTNMGRFDLFPRGITEAFDEYKKNKDALPDLAIEQNLLINYPWPYYFFFNKKDAALADRIEAGLRTMIKDGSFDALFKKYNGAAIEQANIKNRRVIQIKNPFLPKATPLADKSLWFDPQKGL